MVYLNEKPILLIGAAGQLGLQLQVSLARFGKVVTVARQGSDYDIDVSKTGALSTLICQLKPRLIVNAAAYTAVDKAETDVETAEQVNVNALVEIGESAKKNNSPVIHYSTDYVFSGKNDTPWKETDKTEPLGVYGKTKLQGEQALIATGAEAIILRTSWVYSMQGANFLLTMLRLFEERDSLSIVADQIGAPTSTQALAESTSQILSICSKENGEFGFSGKTGLYHCSAAGETSWFGFAKSILDKTDNDCQLSAITTAEYPTPAQRPLYSVLDNTKFKETFGFILPNWELSLRHCMEK